MLTFSSSLNRDKFKTTLRILSVTCFTFIYYINIGIPLAVIPGFVHNKLGYSTIMAGTAISLQYFATLISRPFAGHHCDTRGAKSAATNGLIYCAISGIFLIFAFLSLHFPILSLIFLALSRLLLGVGESLIGTGAILWGIGHVGIENNTKVISWNGIATYGGLALGAPIGVHIAQSYPENTIGVLIVALSLIGFFFAKKVQPTPIIHGEKMAYSKVFRTVLPHGTGLGLATVGFGTISTFITLYYASKNWPNAVLALSTFGTVFVVIRLLFSNTIKRFGGFKVSIISFACESLGLITLWLANTHEIALLGAALTGMGFALIFPALGVEAVALVSPANRGAALSTYTVFLDLSLGITGPLAGYIAGSLGYSQVFLFAAIAALLGIVISMRLLSKAKHQQTSSASH